MKQKTTHKEQVTYLKKIEGQIRGVQGMIEDERYCVDILTQLHSVVGAILRVEDKILRKHLNGCIVDALRKGSELDKQEKLDEIMKLINRFRRSG